MRAPFGPFPPLEKEKKQLEARSHRLGSPQRASPTFTLEVRLIQIHYLLFIVLLHESSLYLLDLVFISVIAFNSYIIELLLRNPLSLVGAHSYKLGVKP